jgi:hypothetical protein
MNTSRRINLQIERRTPEFTELSHEDISTKILAFIDGCNHLELQTNAARGDYVAAQVARLAPGSMFCLLEGQGLPTTYVRNETL